MAIDRQRPSAPGGPPHGLRRHVHRRPARARRADARPGRATAATSSGTPRPGCWGPMITPAIRGGHEVSHAGRGRGRRGRRRARDPHPRHRRHLGGHRLRQRPADGGPLQRRPVLRAGLPRLRRRVAGDARRGHRRRRRSAASPAAPTRRRSRSPTATRSRSTTRAASASRSPRAAAEAFARDAARVRRAAGQLGPEPDPTFAPHDLVGVADAHAPVPRASSARRRASTMPDSHNAGDFGAFLVGAPHRYALRAPSSCSSTRPTATWTSTPSARARSSSARSSWRAAASTSATCTRCRATARSPATPATSRARSRCRSRCSRASASTGRCCSRSRRTCRSWPSRSRRTSARARRRSARRYGVDELEESLPISVVGTGAGPQRGHRQRPGARGASCSACACRRSRTAPRSPARSRSAAHPGVVQVTFRAPVDRLEARGLLGYAVEQYGEAM